MNSHRKRRSDIAFEEKGTQVSFGNLEESAWIFPYEEVPGFGEVRFSFTIPPVFLLSNEEWLQNGMTSLKELIKNQKQVPGYTNPDIQWIWKDTSVMGLPYDSSFEKDADLEKVTTHLSQITCKRLLLCQFGCDSLQLASTLYQYLS